LARLARAPKQNLKDTRGRGATFFRHASISDIISPASLGVIRPSPTATDFKSLVGFSALNQP
jgi:hypothetical protein